MTIGVGRNLDDVGLTDEEIAYLRDNGLAEGIDDACSLDGMRLTERGAIYLLENDIGRSMADLDWNAPWWRTLSDGHQRALVNMCFNLGWPRLSKFKNMLAAMRAGEFPRTAREALDSRWARQVGQRSARIAVQIGRPVREG